MSPNPLPRYLQIASDLRRDIGEGLYKVGDCLPTEAELSRRFGVNRHTVRRSIQLLKQDGILESSQGRGTFVTTEPIVYPIGKRISYTKLLQAQGLTVRRKTLEISELRADEFLAEQLDVMVGDPVTVWRRLGIADEQPLSLGTSYYPSQRLPDIAKHCATYHSVTQLFQDSYGYQHIRKVTTLSARTPSIKDAELLEITTKISVLMSEALNTNQHGEIIELGVTLFRGDRVEIIYGADESSGISDTSLSLE